MKVLVTGGAGYIGSHAVKRLHEGGHRPIVLDNLSRGHREAVDAATAGDGRGAGGGRAHAPTFEQLDLRDTDALANALTYHRVDCVMHFAALAYVGESVDQPLRYYDNNVAGTVSLLQAMDQANVRRLVFSSTCATYGEPRDMPIVENMDQHPINPYGWSKFFVERVLRDHAAARDDFAFTALRYFNVVGSARDGSIGEDHDPETHLIPIVLEVASGRREKVVIFGDDYDTPDGTCIRDYIHVEDLVEAHVAAMEKMQTDVGEDRARFYNLGIGEGKSVQEVIHTAREVTGEPIPAEVGPRRQGDPPVLYANADKIRRELGWEARFRDLRTMVESAWRWFRNHPTGYEAP